MPDKKTAPARTRILEHPLSVELDHYEFRQQFSPRELPVPEGYVVHSVHEAERIVRVKRLQRSQDSRRDLEVYEDHVVKVLSYVLEQSHNDAIVDLSRLLENARARAREAMQDGVKLAEEVKQLTVDLLATRQNNKELSAAVAAVEEKAQADAETMRLVRAAKNAMERELAAAREHFGRKAWAEFKKETAK